jgi:hypothetical protein
MFNQHGIIDRTTRARVVLIDRFAQRGRLGEAHIHAHRRRHPVAIAGAELCKQLAGLPHPRVVHRRNNHAHLPGSAFDPPDLERQQFQAFDRKMLDGGGGDYIVSADQRIDIQRRQRTGGVDQHKIIGAGDRLERLRQHAAPIRASGDDRLCAEQGRISWQKIEARTGFDDATFGRGAIDQDIVERAAGMDPQSHCQVPLGIGIDQQNARALQCQTRTHIDHRCGFADTAVEVCNCNDPCHIPLRTHLRFVDSV